jgi:RNA polymerase sigma-70 factor (ECF subfamily)
VKPDQEARLAALLRRSNAGDEASYGAFLNEVARIMRATVGRRIGSRSPLEAEDIVQETLLAIHLKRHTWQDDRPVGPWIHAIARYKIADSYRRRGTRVEVDIADFEDVLAAEESEGVSDREIGRVLDSLSAGQRQVVASISVEGRSIAETASLLGMKENAVRVALHRGLAAIAARFGRQMP